MNVLELVRRPDLRGSGYFGSAGGLPGRGFREDELVDQGKSGGRSGGWEVGEGSRGGVAGGVQG